MILLARRFHHSVLPPDRDALLRWRASHPVFVWDLWAIDWANHTGFICACLPMQEAALLHRAATGATWKRTTIGSAAVAITTAQRAWGSQVWDIFWERVLRANGGDTAFGSFSSFSEGVVA